MAPDNTPTVTISIKSYEDPLTEEENQVILGRMHQARRSLQRAKLDRTALLRATAWSLDVNRYEYMKSSQFFPPANFGATFNGLALLLYRSFQVAQIEEAAAEIASEEDAPDGTQA